jgi:hypothetical protein
VCIGALFVPKILLIRAGAADTSAQNTEANHTSSSLHNPIKSPNIHTISSSIAHMNNFLSPDHPRRNDPNSRRGSVSANKGSSPQTAAKPVVATSTPSSRTGGPQVKYQSHQQQHTEMATTSPVTENHVLEPVAESNESKHSDGSLPNSTTY